MNPRSGLYLGLLDVDLGGDRGVQSPGVAESAAPAAGPGPVHGNVSVGGLGWQQGKAHLLRGEVDTCEIRHASVGSLVVGSKTSLNITFNTHLR